MDASAMRSGLLVTVAVGLTAIVMRAVAPAPLADLTALAYLVAATTAFSPRWTSAAALKKG